MTRTPPRASDADEPLAPPPVADPAMFHGILGDLVDATRGRTEADPVGVLATLLTGVSALIGREANKPYVMIGDDYHPLLIWSLLLGRTSSGRKGAANSTGQRFLKTATADTYGHVMLPGGLSSGEGLIERIRDPYDDGKDKGGTEDKRLFVVESEFRTVLARARRDGSTLTTILRQAWEGSQLLVLNRTALVASWSHVAISGHITPREFRQYASAIDLAGGTYNRFLPFYVERSAKLPVPAGIDPGDLSTLSLRLRHAMDTAEGVGSVGLDREADNLWRGELYDEMTAADDEDSAVTEFTQRAAPYCRRLAALFAALDGRNMASKADLTAAAAIVRYAMTSASYVLDTRQRDPKLDRLMRAIDAAGNDGLSRTEVSELFARNLDKATLDALLTALLRDARYELAKVPTGGRPAERYRRTKETKEGK